MGSIYLTPFALRHLWVSLTVMVQVVLLPEILKGRVLGFGEFGVGDLIGNLRHLYDTLGNFKCPRPQSGTSAKGTWNILGGTHRTGGRAQKGSIV